MSGHDARMQHLTVFLMQDTCKEFADAVKDREIARDIRVVKKRGFEAGLYVPRLPPHEPVWLEFLQEGFGAGVNVANNKLSSALLFVKVRKRIFVFTFGHSRSMLNDGLFELDFGLRVVVNRIDSSRVRAINLRMYKAMAFKISEEAAKATELRNFPVNIQEDLLRAVAGAPNDRKFAKRMGGADSLVVDLPLKFNQLGIKCEALLAAYKGHDYEKRGFKWIENIRQIRDRRQIDTLDERLVSALSHRGTDVQLVTPEGFARDTITGFRYQGESVDDDPHPDLEILDWYKAALAILKDMDVEDLKRRRIYVNLADGGVEAVPEYHFFSFEVRDGNRVFVFCDGRWNEIGRDILKIVSKYIAGIEGRAVKLPSAEPEEGEDDYLHRIVKERKDLVLMHKALFRMPDGAIELCDVFATRGQLVHVKRWSASGTFSHLLRQGAVSADALRSMPSARKHMRMSVRGRRQGLTRYFPVDGFDASKLTVVYALIRDSKGELPFFSKLGLMRESQQIESMGYKVVFQRIGVS